MDQIALERWYNSFLGLLRADGRGFLHQKPILKKVRQTRNQDAAHAQKRVTVPLSIRADWSRIGVEKKVENILDSSLTTLSSPVQWISYCEWLAPKLACHTKIKITVKNHPKFNEDFSFDERFWYSMNAGKHRSKTTTVDQRKKCLNVSFTACLTSLIFQQYSNGFNDEFKWMMVSVKLRAR